MTSISLKIVTFIPEFYRKVKCNIIIYLHTHAVWIKFWIELTRAGETFVTWN